MQISDEMVEKAYARSKEVHGSFHVVDSDVIRTALEAALSTDAEPVAKEDYKALFEECQLARDEIGFLGSVPDCIRYLDDEVKKCNAALNTPRQPAPSVAVKAGPLAHALEKELKAMGLLGPNADFLHDALSRVLPALPAQVQDVAGNEENRMRRMIERRDEFIIGRGLWDEFMEVVHEAG